MTTYTEDISTANGLLNENKLEEAILIFEKAINKAEFEEQQIDLANSIGRLYLNTNQLDKAEEYFEKSLAFHNNLSEEKAEKLKVNKATILNNLGAIFMNKDLKKTINTIKKHLKFS